MKFGSKLKSYLEKTLPEWRDKFLCYKLLKKLLNNNSPAAAAAGGGLQVAPPRLPLPVLQVWFVGILNEELEKFNDFYVGKEEDLIIRFQALKETIEQVRERERYSSEDMERIRKHLVAIHGEMILLKSYSSLNFVGLTKILKKYDKRTGEMLRLPYTMLASNQPFFITEPLTRLVHECEANYEELFPIEAEVLESTEVAEGQGGTINADRLNASLETTLSLVEETIDIYRSTLATINTIQGITSIFFRSQDNDSTGAVTAENSPCSSVVSMHDVEDENEDACSPK